MGSTLETSWSLGWHDRPDHSKRVRDSSPNRPSGDRKRIAVACNSCRSRRIKCDGNEPTCGTCMTRAQSCEYTHENNRKRHSNAYIQALEARVAVLERLLALRSDTSCLTPPTEPENGSIIGGTQSHIYKPDNEHGNDDRATNQDGVEEIVDALGCFTIGDTGELSYFGGASNFSLIRDHALKISSSADARQRGVAAARMSPRYYEPPDELRNHLLEVFFKWQNSWQRYIHTEPFILDLFVHKTGKYCTPLLLNSVLAMASRFSHRPEIQSEPGDHNTSGMLFASQAIAMLQCECEAPTTSTVQATSLLGLYLASSDNEGLGFMYVGMAARMAMNLGLHLDCSYYAARGMISEDDIQVRHVAFWGLHALDKFYCLGMGRPAGIQENNITVPQPKAQDADIAQLPAEIARIVSPWPESHVVEALKKLSEVFIITSAVLDQLYAQVPDWTRQKRDDQVMQTHLNLMRSFENLPKSLKYSDSGLQPSPPYIYQLHLQYHQSTILMHRPFLKVLYQAQGTVDYKPETCEIHSISCQNAAIKIANIFRIFHLNYACRNMPVSAVHPGFTAAIIHMLDLKTGSPKVQKQAARHLSTLLKCLYDMNANWNWANRSLRGIHSLAHQWKIEAWLQEALHDIDPSQKQSYEKYTSSEHVNVRVPGIFDPENYEAPTAPLVDIFDSWTVDALLDGVFLPDQIVSF